MSNSDRTFIGVCVIFTVTVTVILTLLGQPVWLGVVLGVPLSFAAFALKVFQERKPLPQHFAPAPPVQAAPQPVPPAGQHVHGEPLPSADRDYRFLLHGHVRWRVLPGAESYPPAAVAVNALLQRAGAITARVPAAEHDMLRPRLAAELGTPAPDAAGRVEVWLEDLAVSLPDADLQRLARLADVRKNVEVWEHERAHERNVREYLRGDVLQSTGSAVVWWLAQDPTRVPETVELIGSLDRLAAAAQDRAPLLLPSAPARPEPDLGQKVRGLMDEFVPGAEEAMRLEMADRLAKVASSVGAHESAHEIRLAFNAPDYDAVLDPVDEPAAPTEPDRQAD